ncbi:hypothetical protein JW826_04460 [Candidatus Woesearchaeota archaeon]|nr:hypothetical protein [Candidatus Woesearchaeota archaeon]
MKELRDLIKRWNLIVRFSFVIVVFIFLSSMLLLLSPTENPTGFVTWGFGTVYYVDATSGNDSNLGTSVLEPFQSISKVNGLNLQPGDSVLFKRGESWRFAEDAYLDAKSGSDSGYIYYGSYGSGNRPLFLGSYEMNNGSIWSSMGLNIWEYDLDFNADVGNLIFNDESSVGTKVDSFGSLASQGDFWVNSSSQKVFLYSVSNPANYYSDIEAAKNVDIIKLWSKRYVFFENLDLRYGGQMGLELRNSNNIVFQNGALSYIGGAYQSGTLRYGNCVDIATNNSMIFIINNTISQCYDSGVAVESWLDAGQTVISDIEVYGNQISFSENNIEFFSTVSSSVVSNISFNQNTLINAGRGWSFNQRLSTYGRNIKLTRAPSFTSGIVVKNNILVNSYFRELQIAEGTWFGQYPEIDFNLYSSSGSYLVRNGSTDYDSLYSLSSATGFEVNGVVSDPLLADISAGNLTPLYTSPACNISSTGSYVGAVPCELPPNVLPTHSTPVLNASDYPQNTTNAVLNCYNQSTLDLDDDSVINYYSWFKDGSLMSGLNESSINSGNLSLGDFWICQISPYDGVGFGLALNSSSLQITASQYCGDASCNGVENCSMCAADCGVCLVTENDISVCTLSVKTWNEDAALNGAYNLSGCFNDSLNQTLGFSVAGNSSIRVLIGSDGLVNLSAPANWHGVETVYFTAVDASNTSRNSSTNLVTLTVLSVADCGDDACESGETCSSCSIDCGSCSSGGGGGGGVAATTDADWTCGEWGECVNYKQTQECEHNARFASKTNSRTCEPEGTQASQESGFQEIVTAVSSSSESSGGSKASFDENQSITETAALQELDDNLTALTEELIREPVVESPTQITGVQLGSQKYTLISGAMACFFIVLFMFFTFYKPKKSGL